ncbi:trichohyalin [Sinocyclocheilus grahami]|uniref:Trichohyalin-like n=1 Tax=Sinocyclocheilus grahami TaxID=75366 RepID=A0A672RM74_SINGR|nr:PREDICTED: trichohyalin-like [Sinocyclocheilus grahami]XP_016133781.1 PREDICTED: trichohyalin-like [Sinocyclocheilus grahami]
MNMQTMPHHQFTQHFWEKETVSTKLPYLHREGMSRQRSPSGAHPNSRPHALENQEGPMSSTRERQQPWQHPDNIRRMKHIHLEEQSEYVPSRRASDKLFPLKPVLHKRAYSLSNVTKPEHQERLYSCLTDQAAVRHQQKVVRKLDALNLIGRTNQTKSDMDREQKLEAQTWLSKEIHSKEMVLQEKIFKAEETLRRVQKERKDSAMRDERNKRYSDKLKEDNRFYSSGYGDWAEERDRYGNEKWEFRDDMERWGEWERGINGSQLERSKDSAKWGQQPLMLEMAKARKLEETREWDEYEHIAKHRSREMSNRQNMGWDNVRRRRATQNLYLHNEDDVRKPNLSDSERRDRPHLKHERREHKDGSYRLASKLTKEAVPERNPRQRGKRLELSLEEDPVIPCDVCHRCFARDRLETHMRVCEKKRPQRKIFDMSQYRAKGTDLEEFMKTNSRSKTPELKKNNWRQKHEAFIQTMRQGQGSVPPQLVLNLNPEYVSCPHCGRRFAPGPAERHIPKCQNIKSRPPPPKQLHSATRRKTTQ